MAKGETERRAAEAQQLIDNPMLQEAFSAVREGLIEAIEINPLTDDLLRDKLMLSLQLLRHIRTHLEDYIISGKLSKRITEDFK